MIDNLPPTNLPVTPPPQPAVGQPKRSQLALVLAVIFGLGTVVFGLISVVALNQSRRAIATINQAKADAATDAAAQQKQIDEENFRIQNQSPYRSYLAPAIFGGFEIKFPKSWSGYAVESEGGQQQINLLLHPDFVKQTGGDDMYAARVVLARQTFEQVTALHQDNVKKGRLVLASITVSGIKGSRYSGKFDGKHDGVTVVLPVRDKTIVISTDHKKYLKEYNEILAQSKIVP